MVLTDFKTGSPLVPGDMNYDDSKPTAENVLHIFDTYKKQYEAFHDQCEEEDEYYHGTRSVPIPDDMPIDPVRPATAHAIVNVATDHVDVNNPSIFVPAPSPRAKNRSESIHTLQSPRAGGLNNEEEPLLKPSLRRSHKHSKEKILLKPSLRRSHKHSKEKIRFRHTNLAGPLKRMTGR